MNVRAAAASVLAQVLSAGRSLSSALTPGLAEVARNERALAQELCYGTLRYAPRLQALLARLMRKPLKPGDADIHGLLLLGLYQLAYMRTPEYAAVTETVAAARALRKPWAAALVNGVLRNYARDRVALDSAVDADPAARYAHPVWLLEALQQAWPTHWAMIAEANNARPPLTLRVNAQRVSREAYLAQLAAVEMAAVAVPHAPHAVMLETPVDVERLPGFAAGEVSVQDAAAQLAGGLLDIAPGQRVLDACAAPGGKTAQLLELQPAAQVTAVDYDAARVARIHDTLTRLQLHAEVLIADAADPAPWWDGAQYDRILLDAPCSASGVIRRHPDIKALRRADDIAPLATQQQRLLHALWPLLAPGGVLLYVTCSVLPQENTAVIADFCAVQGDAEEWPLAVAWGHAQTFGRQILPGEDGMDGFYFCRLRKPRTGD